MQMDIIEQKISSVVQLDNFEDEYVYDIVMEDGTMPYFFANDILVHNSCYFLTGADNKEDAVRIADETGAKVNSRFPDFMREAFNCQGDHAKMIKASREIVGSAGLFLPAKKKYTIKVVNLDGYDLPVPKLKTMGSEMKKADTPKIIQDFLKELLNKILDDANYQEVEKYVNSQRGNLIRRIKNPVYLGAAKQINNLDEKYAEWKRTEKVGNGKVQHLPGHVRAAINYNEMVTHFKTGDTLLKSGDKGIVFYLLPNEFGIKAIAFPADISTFPQWFVDNFKIDRKLTEEKLIDSKIEGTFNTMGWEVPTPQKSHVKKLLSF